MNIAHPLLQPIVVLLYNPSGVIDTLYCANNTLLSSYSCVCVCVVNNRFLYIVDVVIIVESVLPRARHDDDHFK